MFPSVPAALAILGVGFEIFRFAAKRMNRLGPPALATFAAWAIRPWTLWAFFNLFYRWRWDQGFNNRRTFPFYANLWVENETFAEAGSRILHSPGLLWGGVALAILLAMGTLLAWVLRRPPRRAWPALAGLVALAAGLHLSLACLPEGAWTGQGQNSSLLSPWNNSGSTMLYTLPHIKNSRDYFRRFLEIQPKLRMTIHGLSHPPAASLSLYWIGKALGMKGKDIRAPEVRLRYSIGLALFGALNAVILFWLARSLFDARTGFLAAALWATAPSVSAYATFAQDSVYAVFFNLALLLGWHAATAERRAALWGCLLGVDFFAMTLLSYSWCLVTAIFALFALAMGLRNRWRIREYFVRLVLPLSVMTALAAGFLAQHRLDYWAMYLFSSQYVNQWYAYANAYQWTLALVGGQLDLFLLLGSVTCAAFVSALARFRKASFRDPRAIYLGIVLGIFALPLLFGPNCLKMEAARCWIWMASLPIAFAAARLLQMNSRLFAIGAPVVSALTYAGLRLFLDFAT